MKQDAPIPTTVRTEIEKEAEVYAERKAFRVPYDGSNNFYDDKDYESSKAGHIAGQESMYRKQQVEIDRLKQLLEMELKHFLNEKLWHQFKTENNI